MAAAAAAAATPEKAKPAAAPAATSSPSVEKKSEGKPQEGGQQQQQQQQEAAVSTPSKIQEAGAQQQPSSKQEHIKKDNEAGTSVPEAEASSTAGKEVGTVSRVPVLASHYAAPACLHWQPPLPSTRAPLTNRSLLLPLLHVQETPASEKPATEKAADKPAEKAAKPAWGKVRRRRGWGCRFVHHAWIGRAWH